VEYVINLIKNNENTAHAPVIKVACAIIERDGAILVAQRSESMSMPLKWEFPGGKLEQGEDSAACLARELREELGVAVAIRYALPPVVHDYGAWVIELFPFVCELTAGKITLHEHKAIIWQEPLELFDLDWPAADLPVIAEYLRYLNQKQSCQPL
jgi:8-oxo-dGTP diphosphatase